MAATVGIMRYPGVISTPNGDTDCRRFSGICYYEVTPSDLESHFTDPPLQAWRSFNGNPTYDFGHATYRSVDSFPFDTHDERLEAIRWLDMHNYGLRYSSSSLLRSLSRKYVRISPLCEDAWGIGLSSVHQGHMTCVRRGLVTYSALSDIKSAYLSAMYETMPPTLTQPVVLDKSEFPTQKHIEDGWQGVVSAWWHVDDDKPLPFVPTNIKGAIIYPYGEVYATLTADMAREAIRQGNRITEVRRAMAYVWAHSGAHFEELADVIRKLPKDIGKPLYTRFFGSMCGAGHYYFSVDMLDDALAEREAYTYGEKSYGAKPTEFRHFDGSLLPWVERSIFTGEPPHTGFRPDVAAAIAAVPAIQLGKAIETFGRHVLATHVDSVITDGPTVPGQQWAIKASGAYEGFGIGNYVCGAHVATAGRPPDMSVHEWLAGIGRDNTRLWCDDGTSTPLTVSRESYLLTH